MQDLQTKIRTLWTAALDSRVHREALCEALQIVADRLAALAPESAPPVPVTIPDAPPAAVGMTAEEFYAELDAIEAGARRNGTVATVTHAVDLGARWRAATGLPLPTRPKGQAR